MNWNSSIISKQIVTNRAYSKYYKIFEKQLLNESKGVADSMEWLAEQIQEVCGEITKLQNTSETFGSICIEDKIGKKIEKLNGLIQKKEFENKEWEKIQGKLEVFKALPAPRKRKKH